ncbi:GHKL domain-containing protein [Paratractidigestivibacter sp.]|uniref:GHKL domain-containing protein n=1 Tax=Paratractidigestivibacter sp. TaxID=2847316 RepID=UPI002AC99236|nr:GHKL domain-containing protein [Paratractidigestivibacter sp.]
MELFNLINGETVNTGTFITDVLFAVCAVILFGELKPSAKAIAINALEVLLVYALENALWLILDLMLGLANTSAPSYWALFGALAIYALTQRRLTFTDRLVRFSTFGTSFMITVSITGIFGAAVPVIQRFSFWYAIPSVLSYVMMLTFAIVLRVFSIAHFHFVPSNFVGLIVATDIFGVAAAQSFILFMTDFKNLQGYSYASNVLGQVNHSASLVNLLVDASFLLLILFSYIMFYVLAKEHEQRAELLITQKSESDAEAMMGVTYSMNENLREMRHELKNHDAYMASLLEAGEYDKLRVFFEDCQAINYDILHYVSCGNPLVDAVVNAKMSLARSKGVEVQTMLAVPEVLPFSEAAVFSLVANLLDNAIEGTLASAAPQGPIHLTIRPAGGYYVFSVSNPCNPKKVRRNDEGALLTSKGNGQLHGYGTKVIAGIAERYSGVARFKTKGTTFEADVMLAAARAE